jgi:hypothetical protein
VPRPLQRLDLLDGGSISHRGAECRVANWPLCVAVLGRKAAPAGGCGGGGGTPRGRPRGTWQDWPLAEAQHFERGSGGARSSSSIWRRRCPASVRQGGVLNEKYPHFLDG